MAAKKGVFQKTDQKKLYSENVLNNVESVYRPKNRQRVGNPISSNTMSGEETNDFEEPVTQKQNTIPQARFKKPVGYAFAGSQAKRQKQDAQREASMPAQIAGNQPQPVVFSPPSQVGKIVLEEKSPEPQIQVCTGTTAKKKTDAAIQKRAPEKSRKLSQPEIQIRTGSPLKKNSHPEIQIRTGSLARKLSQPEIRVHTGNIVAGPTLETSVAFELIQAAIMLEAMQAPEVDVQETRGNYEPLEESEVKSAKSLILQNLFLKTPAPSEAQYELDLDSTYDLDAIAMEEFQHTEIAETQIQSEPRSIEDTSAAEAGLSFDSEACAEDTKKTRLLNVAKQGIKRSRRGTIEAVFQPDGNIVQAQYNCCGILIEVSVGGAVKLTRAADTGKWTMCYRDGSQPLSRVKGVAFDRLGNLFYSTEDGRTIVICADGRVIEK
ncbi:MAG: hypothetical protein IT342_12265 [Candidatus Melainabacteria bacterium]|nr:hypothetical protein [Candidatus Melainabacteria bacterium]